MLTAQDHQDDTVTSQDHQEYTVAVAHLGVLGCPRQLLHADLLALLDSLAQPLAGPESSCW